MKAFDQAHEWLTANTDFSLHNQIIENSQRGIHAVYSNYYCKYFTREEEIQIFETLNKLCGKHMYIHITNRPENVVVMIVIQSKKKYLKDNSIPYAPDCTINNWGAPIK